MTGFFAISKIRAVLDVVLFIVVIFGGVAGMISLFLMPPAWIPMSLMIAAVFLFLCIAFDVTSRTTTGKPLIWWSRPRHVLLVLAASFTNLTGAVNANFYLGFCLVVMALLLCRVLAKGSQRLSSRRRV